MESRKRSAFQSVPASPEVQRRFRRLGRFMVIYTPVMLLLSFLPIVTEPWLWIKVGVIVVGTIIFGIWVIRFSLWQRDEYWRERGKDPKHPERLGRVDDGHHGANTTEG
ncbi:hypothetical protein ARGLB_028_00240 [Arthrobacter globiformis NBRC 12137]|uniref:Uncharacterized protein n=2 Tax=Arthrobacter globiformis TaxID=1665 RepID=H0QJ98_ARTG1|nr:hypothetical protein ARGLB_028_00240 [Arthrobacter globiformis NBRC 12137]